MKIDTKLILIAILIIGILLTINLWVILSTEHYKVGRYEVIRFDSFRQIIYYDGGSIRINKFYFPIENDFNLSKGDDILISYVESILGGKTYIRIENLSKR